MFSPRTFVSIAKGILTKQSPFYIQYYIIAQCNLACRMCNIVEANSDLMPASLSDVEKIAKNLRKVGAGVVLLTGGEPFMHKELPKIVEIFVKQGLSPRLQTAGIATREQLQACYDAGARHINISLDSLIEEKQDYLNGSKRGSWQRALRAIADVNAVFKARNRLCALGTVMSKFNYQEIPAILEFARQIGWWVSLVPVHITSLDSPHNFRGTDADFSFGKEDHSLLDDVLKRLIAMKRTHPLFDSVEFLKSSVNYLKTGKVTWRKFNRNVCDSPNLYFAVLPNGDFSVCCDHRYQGKLNLAQDDFNQIYRSKGFRAEVFKTTSTCGGCNFGSYPEISLLARDKKAMLERFTFAMGMKNRQVPDLSFSEIVDLATDIRETYGLANYRANWDAIRPSASSQRYDGVKILDRKAVIPEWAANKRRPEL